MSGKMHVPPKATPLWVTWNALRPAKTVIETGDLRVCAYDLAGTRLMRVPASGRMEVEVGTEPVYTIAEPTTP